MIWDAFMLHVNTKIMIKTLRKYFWRQMRFIFRYMMVKIDYTSYPKTF